MSVDASAICPGVVFSSLITEQLGYAEMQEGFLLGSSVQHTSTHISDAHISKETVKESIYISSYHCLDMLGCLYDSSGHVRGTTVNSVANMARDNKQTIVGWYVWRRCSEALERLLLRERLVHQQLRETLGNPRLLLLVCSARKDGADAFPTTSCLLNMYISREFVRVPLHISNLGNTSNTDYKLEPPNPGIYNSPALESMLTTIQCTEPGVDEVLQLHLQLEAYLKKQLLQVSELQVQHRSRLRHLMALRSYCYHRGIVPDFELPSMIDKVKKMDATSTKESLASAPSPPTTVQNCTNISIEPHDNLDQIKSKPKIDDAKNSPKKKTVLKRIVTPDAKEEGKATRGPIGKTEVIDSLNADLHQLSVCNESSPRRPASGVSPKKRTTHTSPASPGRAQSATRMSRPGSAVKAKRRISSNSPGVITGNKDTQLHKVKQAWKS